jgi:hypothetical protein
LLLVVLRVNAKRLQIFGLPFFPLLLLLLRNVLVKRLSVFFDPEFLVIVNGDLDDSVAADFFFGTRELGHIGVFQKLLDGRSLRRIELEAGSNHVKSLFAGFGEELTEAFYPREFNIFKYILCQLRLNGLHIFIRGLPQKLQDSFNLVQG